jgi:hypothetical protein
MDYGNWAPGEPNNALDGESCAHIELVQDRAHYGKWNDINCKQQWGYVCKIRKTTQGK